MAAKIFNMNNPLPLREQVRRKVASGYTVNEIVETTPGLTMYQAIAMVEGLGNAPGDADYLPGGASPSQPLTMADLVNSVQAIGVPVTASGPSAVQAAMASHADLLAKLQNDKMNADTNSIVVAPSTKYLWAAIGGLALILLLRK